MATTPRKKSRKKSRKKLHLSHPLFPLQLRLIDMGLRIEETLTELNDAAILHNKSTAKPAKAARRSARRAK